MKIYDVVWGNLEIKDKEAIKIIKHPAFKRLKNIYISAYGYLFELKRNSTRYEHCIGVYLLLKHFTAPKKEQIAGLIHDVSHTALSHVSTYAFQGKYTGTEFHELQQHKFIEESGLAELLKTMGYESKEVLHDKAFTLLENDLPDICADRLDYALRDGIHLQILSRQQVNKIIEGIVVKNGEFVFNNIESAFIYSFNFYLLNLLHYGSPAEAHFNNDFGNLVKYAMEKGVLEEKDWYTDDKYLITKLKKSKNKDIKAWLKKYNNKLVIYEDIQTPTIVFQKKIRIVNPKVLVINNETDKEELKRLTEVSDTYKQITEEYIKNHTKHELSVRVEYKN